MIALLLNNQYIIGSHPDIDTVIQSGHPYMPWETVPSELNNLSANETLRFDNGVFVVETVPVVPSEIDLLKMQVNELTAILGDLILMGGM